MSFRFNVGQRVRVIEVVTSDFDVYLDQIGVVVGRYQHPPDQPDTPACNEYAVRFREQKLPDMLFDEYELARVIDSFKEEASDVQGV